MLKELKFFKFCLDFWGRIAPNNWNKNKFKFGFDEDGRIVSLT
jgi:hypothetical protein